MLTENQTHAAKWTGILYMQVAIGFLSSMDAVAKWLIENSVHTLQILALRSVFIVPALLLVFATKGSLGTLRPTRPVAQMIRGLTGFLAPLSFFIGISLMPLTAAVVVFFSSIFMTTLLSVFFLNEKVGVHRWVAVLLGYCGVFIAIAPGSGGSLLGYLLVLFSSFSYSVLFISGRLLSKTESVPSLVLTYNLGVGIVALLFLPWFWQPMDLYLLTWVVVLSIFAVLGHLCLTHAFSLAEASLIAPFEYTSILWTIGFDLAIWHTLPGYRTWLGAVIIIASGLYVIHRERVNASTVKNRAKAR